MGETVTQAELVTMEIGHNIPASGSVEPFITNSFGIFYFGHCDTACRRIIHLCPYVLAGWRSYSKTQSDNTSFI